MAHTRKTLYGRKNLADISYTRRVQANFVPNFIAMATEVGRGKMQLAAFDGPSPGVGPEKMQLAAFDGPSPKPPPHRRKKSRKNLLRKPSYSPFCPKFRCHGNESQSG